MVVIVVVVIVVVVIVVVVVVLTVQQFGPWRAGVASNIREYLVEHIFLFLGALVDLFAEAGRVYRFPLGVLASARVSKEAHDVSVVSLHLVVVVVVVVVYMLGYILNRIFLGSI